MTMKATHITDPSNDQPSPVVAFIDHRIPLATHATRNVEDNEAAVAATRNIEDNEAAVATTNVSMSTTDIAHHRPQQQCQSVSSMSQSSRLDQQRPITLMSSLFHNDKYFDSMFNIGNNDYIDTFLSSQVHHNHNYNHKRNDSSLLSSSLAQHRLVSLNNYLQEALDLADDLCLVE